MYLKHIFVHTCQFIILLNITHTYVLLAANLDDFKSIAKKFIPNKLAEQLASIAAKNSGKILVQRQQLNKYKQVDTHKDNDEYSDEITKAVTKPQVRQVKTTQKKRFAIKDQVEGVDFDELVDRVREQLEVKFKNKLKEELKQEEEKNEYYYEEENAYTEEVNKDNQAAKIEKTTKNKVATSISTTAIAQMYYEDDVTESAEPALENVEMQFKEADLTKTKDSYEDYVIPDKDKVFESDSEPKTTKTHRVPSEQQSRYKAQIPKEDKNLVSLTEKKSEVMPLAEDLDYEVEYKSEEKAKTGSIFDESDKNGAGNKPKKLKGTMIPTREYFKMSSPNYIAKIPVVAEKYDFNEPLPEQDREPEDLKYFGNPQASINKKVKLTSN